MMDCLLGDAEGQGVASPVQGEIQVRPIGTHLLDQGDLPVAAPLLEALLAGDSLVDAVVDLVPDEAAHIVLGGEAGDELAPVFIRSPRHIVRHAKIQRAMAAACEEVDVKGIG